MPPKRAAPKAKTGPRGMAKPITPGLVLTDLLKKQWKLGPVIGQGGFGYIYLGAVASDSVVTSTNAEYVIKVEPHDNGPLFVELHFYTRVAKAEIINTWMKDKKISQLGVPLFHGSGSFDHGNTKYRFVVISRFGIDVEKLYTQNDNIFPAKTVYSLGLRIVDVLEYLHDNDYVHADIKASNLMVGYKKGDTSKVYLVDYGLAHRYRRGETHAMYKEDPKRKHDGTIEYTSRDAHRGAEPTRRGDMEILGYCMVQWLCRKLPWEDKLPDKDYVFKQKEKYMGNLKEFMSKCFTEENCPVVLQEYLELVNKMGYDEKPDYQQIRKLLKSGMKKYGVVDDGKTVCLPTVNTSEKLKVSAVASPKKARTALKDLQPKNSPRKAADSKSSNTVPGNSNSKVLFPAKRTRTPSPAKRTRTPSPAKRTRTPIKKQESLRNVSPIKTVQASVGVRRSPRHTSIISDDNSDEDNGTLAVKKVKTNIDIAPKEVVNNSDIGHCSDHVVMHNGAERTVHRRIRKKNVPCRDFAQSP